MATFILPAPQSYQVRLKSVRARTLLSSSRLDIAYLAGGSREPHVDAYSTQAILEVLYRKVQSELPNSDNLCHYADISQWVR